MFTPAEKQMLIDALDASIASQKRGYNTSKNPQFKELYKKVEDDLNALKLKVNGLKDK